MNHPIMFPDRDNKIKLVPASTLMKEKMNLKSVTVIILIMSLHHKETNKLIYLHCSCKKVAEK